MAEEEKRPQLEADPKDLRRILHPEASTDSAIEVSDHGSLTSQPSIAGSSQLVLGDNWSIVRATLST